VQTIGAGVRGLLSLSIPTEMDWQRHITAASGYLDLGTGQEAWDELDSMPPEDRARSEVVVMRLVILPLPPLRPIGAWGRRVRKAIP